jgi:hypothetical protein
VKLNPHNISLFSLFHHDISELDSHKIAFSKQLLSNINSKISIDSEELNQQFIQIIKNKITESNSINIGLTLTGGLDSRVLLATLLNLGIKPICICYGNSNSRDVQIAQEICRKFDLVFFNPIASDEHVVLYKEWTKETLQISEGKAHLHRAHRHQAIKLAKEKFDIQVLFTGHFGSETIRGYSPNNYMTSSILNNLNSSINVEKGNLEIELKRYFVRTELVDFEKVKNQILLLPWLQGTPDENIFFYLQNLVKDIHHQQDIDLYKKQINSVYPVFMFDEVQELFTKSKFHSQRNLSRTFKSLHYLDFYYQFIRTVFPSLLEIELSNGYVPKNYGKGKVIYGMNKFILKYINKKKSNPTFKYDDWFQILIKSEFENIDSEIWNYYDKDNYEKSLFFGNHRTNEGYWHKFSNPFMFSESQKLNRENSNS